MPGGGSAGRARGDVFAERVNAAADLLGTGVSTAEAALSAAISGAGFARLFCYQAAEAVRRGELCLVLEEFELDPQPINFLHTAGRAIPAKIRSLLDFAVPKLRAELSRLALPKRNSVVRWLKANALPRSASRSNS